MAPRYNLRLTLLLLLLAPAAWAAPTPKTAVIIAEAGSDAFEVFFPNVYLTHKGHLVRPKQPVVLAFDENAFSPTLVQFVFKLKADPRNRIVSHRLIEVPPPILLLAAGDTIRVRYHDDQNTFAFRGRHQAELDFCRQLWQSAAPLARLFGNVGEPVMPLTELDSTESPQYYIGLSKPPRLLLSEHLRTWYGRKQEAEARIAELRRLAGVRPEIAASLTRHIRLRLFMMLTGAVGPRNSRDSLRIIPAAYRDTVAAEARLLTAMQTLPLAAADGLGLALLSYNRYQCVQERHFPTVGTQYTHAEQTLTGFHRAWVCYLILEVEGRRRHKDIRRWQHDYETWVKPYDEFARVLRGEPTVPLRSYQTTATSDSVVSAAGLVRHLTDVLAAHRGKVVLLDLWASWCVPCREEIPHSVAVANHYRSRGLVVLYFSIDKEMVAWQQALRKLPVGTRNQYRFQHPDATAFRQQFEINTVPRYMLIDRAGTICSDDALRPSDPRLGAVLEKLLAR